MTGGGDWQMHHQVVAGQDGSGSERERPTSACSPTSVDLRNAGSLSCLSHQAIYLKLIWQMGTVQANFCPHIACTQLQPRRREKTFSEKSVGCKCWYKCVIVVAKVDWGPLLCLVTEKSSSGIILQNKCKFWPKLS